jgi:CRISPR type III-B/RAMP module RAMP protein Cmr1
MTTKLTFITPCFCAGAEHTIAEIRPSALRGELRWWFRCLGGTKQQEAEVFGSMAGEGNAGKVQVRVSNFQRSENLHSPTFVSPNDAESYHHYLLTAPNDKGISRMWKTPPNVAAKQKGSVRPESQIPTGSNFTITIRTLRSIHDVEAARTFEKAVDCTFEFGSIGYRKTRGFGAWRRDGTLPTRSDLEAKLKSLLELGFSYELAQGGSPDSMVVFHQIEGRLKGDRLRNTGLRLNHKAKDPTPLGYSSGKGKRQTSAVLFRPIAFVTKKGATQYELLILQAPDSVLGDDVKIAYAGKTRIIP